MSAPLRTRVQSPTVLGWLCVATASVSVAVALAVMAPSMNPVQPGTSAEFWECATDVHFAESPSTVRGHVYGPRDGWYYYAVSSRDGGFYLHGNEFHCVREADVRAEFNRVVEHLRSPPPGVAYRERIRAAFRKWDERVDQSTRTPSYLLLDLRRAREAEQATKDPSLISSQAYSDIQFEGRHIQSRWYWAAIAFEWVFLSGLVLFAAWPAIKRRSWKRWAVHFGLLPLLFVFPAYLGYATYSFTSAGPTGGIVYPYLLAALPRGSCNEVDQYILRHIPQLLEPMSSGLLFPVSLSGQGMPGPTNLLVVGGTIAGLVVATHFGYKRFVSTSGQTAGQCDPNIADFGENAVERQT